MYLTIVILFLGVATVLSVRFYQERLEDMSTRLLSPRSAVFLFSLLILSLLAVNPENIINQTAPSEGDARAHIGRIILFSPLSVESFYWSTAWYEGFPYGGFYPPLFYLFGSVVSELFSEIVTYKLLRFVTLFGLTSSIYYIARSCGLREVVAYLTTLSTLFAPIVPYTMYRGAFPFLLGVTLSLFTVGSVVRYGPKLRVFVLMALSLLAHPYSALIIVGPGLGWLVVYRGHWNVRDILVGGFVTAGLAGVHYFPFVYRYTRHYSPAPLIENVTLSNVLVLFVSVPLIGVFFLLYYSLKVSKTQRVIIMISGGTGAALIALLPNIDSSVTKIILGWRFLLPSWIFLTVALVALFAVANRRIESHHVASSFVLFFIVLSVALPAVGIVSGDDTTLGTHYDGYYNERPDGLMEFNDQVGDNRVISRARLGDVYSPVTFAPREGYSTVTGPYNQGDPYFFRTHVYVEWQSKYLEYEVTRENLMELTGAQYLTTNAKWQRTPVSSSPSGETIYGGNLTGTLDAKSQRNEYNIFESEVSKNTTLRPTDQIVIEQDSKRLENAWVSVDILDQNGNWWRFRSDISEGISRNQSVTTTTLFAGYRTNIDGENVGPTEPIKPQRVRIVVDDFPDEASGSSRVTLRSVKVRKPDANLTLLGEGWVLAEARVDRQRTVEGEPILIETEGMSERVIANHLSILPASGPQYIFVGPESDYPVNETQGLITDSPELAREFREQTDSDTSVILLNPDDQFQVSYESNISATVQTGDFFQTLPTTKGVPSGYFEDQDEPYPRTSRQQAQAISDLLNRTFEQGDPSSVTYQATRGEISVKNLSEEPVLLRQSYSPFWSAPNTDIYRSMTGQVILDGNEGPSPVIEYDEPVTTLQVVAIVLLTTGLVIYWRWKR